MRSPHLCDIEGKVYRTRVGKTMRFARQAVASTDGKGVPYSRIKIVPFKNTKGREDVGYMKLSKLQQIE